MVTSANRIVLTSLMLFSMFFGAGNLIFPPLLGQSAGDATSLAMIGFIASAVGLPILGVAAIAKTGGFEQLAGRVHPLFAILFPLAVYLAIGPLLAIPRAGSLAYEMGVAPFLPEGWNGALPLFIYTLLFFGFAYFLALDPDKLAKRFGAILTPALLLLIGAIITRSFFVDFGETGSATGAYAASPIAQGFQDGYLTMDALASLAFGIVVLFALKNQGAPKERLVKETIYAGAIAGSVLLAVYLVLGYLGAKSTGLFAPAENGAGTLTNLMLHFFGQPGGILLGLLFTLACLTTSVGLITSCAQYFAKQFPRVSYRSWMTILTVSSLFTSNLGLSKILQVSVPVLTFVYPAAIVLILLGLVDDYLRMKRLAYAGAISFALAVGLFDALQAMQVLDSPLSFMPFAEQGFAWATPAVLFILIGMTGRKEEVQVQEETA
ncbi:branched-chain amino acid transport system II carrier protein [Exiguobacterium flavidum]|uniref:branched-chain amino acid transport system II carrier protein n=1 Tax=Exiguobacterium flavidum TaxID=2184695 RepID=UPI000DF800A8|nr:branched-chain amino acid transport system II carrier protein [Exiguobacterium flavidum]